MPLVDSAGITIVIGILGSTGECYKHLSVVTAASDYVKEADVTVLYCGRPRVS